MSLQPPIRAFVAAGAAAAAWAALPAAAAAHGVAPAEPPTVATIVFGWTFEPTIVIPLLAAALVWRWAVNRVRREHPRNPVPRIRSVAFYGSLAATAVA